MPRYTETVGYVIVPTLTSLSCSSLLLAQHVTFAFDAQCQASCRALEMVLAIVLLL